MLTGPLHAIVLAAGSATRFGGGKLTAPVGDGGVLLDGALAAAFAAPVASVVVTWGGDPGVPDAALGFAAARRESERLTLVAAPDHAQGLSASLRAGIAALPPDAAGAFLFLGDMPRVPHDLARRLLERLDGPVLASAPVRGGVRGHPVLVMRSLFPALVGLGGDRGAKQVLDDLGDRLALVETADEGVLYDVDRPQDLGS